MAVNNDYPVLDGAAPSWADISVKAQITGGSLLEIKDIAAINTGTTVEIGEQRGASGGRVMRRTTGQKSDEGSMTLYRSGFQDFIRALMAIAPVRGNQRILSQVKFDIQVQHTPFGSDEIYEYRLKGCRYLGRTMNGAEGVDADQVECPLSVGELVDVVDGVEAVAL
jgi:hypothetical protein